MADEQRRYHRSIVIGFAVDGLLSGIPRADLVDEMRDFFGRSSSWCNKWIARAGAEIAAEGADEIPARKRQMRLFLWGIAQSAIEQEKPDRTAALNAAALLIKLDGLGAPDRIEVSTPADTLSGVSLERLRQLDRQLAAVEDAVVGAIDAECRESDSGSSTDEG